MKDLPNIAELDADDLNALRDKIEQRIIEMRDAEAPALLERFEIEAAKLGLSMKALVMRRKTVKRGRRSNGHDEARP
jgi:hypothetical protein